jgi:hypothetical protein
MAYQMARDMGAYASRVKYCEFILNNQYQGICILLEKIKRGKHRVNIAFGNVDREAYS